MSVKKIYEGWKNNVMPSKGSEKYIKAVSDMRIKICEECEHHSKHIKSIRPDAHCTHCGCTLSAKTKCLSCKCPIDKWLEQ